MNKLINAKIYFFKYKIYNTKLKKLKSRYQFFSENGTDAARARVPSPYMGSLEMDLKTPPPVTPV